MGCAAQMNAGIDFFFIAQFIVESTEKKNHYKLNLSLFSPLEAHLAFYLRYALLFPFQNLISSCSSHCA
jgi:hypothetical protein